MLKRSERQSEERLAAAHEAAAPLEHQAEARIAALEAARQQAVAPPRCPRLGARQRTMRSTA